MNINTEFVDLVRKRSSVRKYDSKEIKAELLISVKKILDTETKRLFGSEIRYKIIKNYDTSGNSKFGTYGFISGAPYYIAGAVSNNPGCFVDYGFVTERIVLELTKLGLGTCWLGGTFSRSTFAAELNLSKNEILPAITPVGFATEKRGFREKLIRFGAKSDTRLPFTTLFFDKNFDTPLEKTEFETLLECVRMAPSASNKQPWRIIVNDKSFSFYLKRTPGYGMFTPGNDLQLVDMGIALAHFILAIEASGYKVRISDSIKMQNYSETEAIAELTLV